MNVLQSIVLGIVEGLTEFLPVSSTGHLTIAEKLLGLPVDDDAITAFTAVVQSGAILAVLIYFRGDIHRLLRAAGRGVARPSARTGPDWRLACAVVLGSLPIGIVGIAARGVIEGPLRNLGVVGAALVLWSAVIVFAERTSSRHRGETSLRIRDALRIGVLQCVALVPGVSRSGATISGGLLLGFDRVTATRLSFFLSIPAMTGAAALELPSALGSGVGFLPTLVGTFVAFVVAYASVAWLLRFVSGHSIAAFVPYRVAVGLVVLAAVALP